MSETERNSYEQTDPELIQSGPEVAQTVYNDDCCHEEVLGVICNRTDLYNKTSGRLLSHKPVSVCWRAFFVIAVQDVVTQYYAICTDAIVCQKSEYMLVLYCNPSSRNLTV